MKKIFFTLLLLSFSASAKAENFLMAENMNDPIYSDDSGSTDVAEVLTDSLVSQQQNMVAPATEDPLDSDKSLVVRDVSIQRFFLKESEAPIVERLSDTLDEHNLSVEKLSFKREGSQKAFTYDQIKKVVIKTKFSIESLDVIEEENRFTSVLKPQLGKYRIEVTGSYSENQKVPVLSRNIGKGEKISQNDIELKNTARNQIVESDITDISKIIGKTATHQLSKGKMVTEEDIRDQIIVNKSSSVSAIYRTDSIEIKALAVALEEGGEGDMITLKNFDSGKVFKAIVQADGTVVIDTTPTEFTASLPEANELNNIN